MTSGRTGTTGRTGRALAAGLAAAALATAAPAVPAAAQETAVKAGFSTSRLEGNGGEYFSGSITSTTFGGHMRFRFGPVLFQPELMVTTRGGTADSPAAPLDEEQLRLEYIDVPLLLVVPVRIGNLEPFAFAGPSIMLESRCRWQVREEGLRSVFSCEPAPADQVFRRRAVDFGAVAGGGAAYPVLSGRVIVEGRHTWGLRNIHSGPGDAEAFNRTFTVMIGYAVGWQPGG